MSSQRQPVLLVECWQHVLSYLQFVQTPSLCSLLRVNKMFYGLTVPLLYNSPFVLVKGNAVKWNEEERTERLVMLLRLFLAELDPALQAELPPWTTEEDDDDLQEGWINDNADDKDKEQYDKKHLPDSTVMVRKYFYHYRWHDHSFLIAKIIPIVFGLTEKRDCHNILHTLDQLFLRHNGGSVLSMCVSVKPRSITQLESLLPTLSCLRRIEVHNIEDMAESSLDKLVDLIHAHDQSFGTLRELQVGGLTEYDEYDLSRDSFMIKLAHAMHNLTVLDTKSWTEAWSMVDQLPVEQLERLALEYGGNKASNQRGEFLLRCRRLKVLDLFVPTPNTLRAVAEYVAPTAGSSPRIFSPSSFSSGPSVPPLERLYLSGSLMNLKQTVEDAVASFAGTLKILKVTSITRSRTTVAPSIRWEGAYMPQLTELQLQHDIALELPFSILGRVVPNLTIFKLLVNGLESCGQENNPVDGILALTKLQILQLLGTWPLTLAFIRGLRTQVTGLKILDIERCFGIGLDETMRELSQMEYLWRVGWDLENVSDEVEAVVEQWRIKAPRIEVGPIGWDEYYV
ncbi:hypothetical protein BG006_006957 [Podila minutissima]|uniref:Uncharacterized protein n=1 Tax=Podila minutissima TaxID=64525 RepID=A0A9P5VL15_9FUNG|nr:hypothetical protein BG006_006957 [Podila minutissima]